MTATQQIDSFTAFAKAITKQEGEHITLDEIYDRWWQKQHVNEDLAAINEAHVQYKGGERVEDARDELAAFKKNGQQLKKYELYRPDSPDCESRSTGYLPLHRRTLSSRG